MSKVTGKWVTQDSTHRFVTDTQISSWNGKEDASNKSTSTSLGTSDTLYPSQNAVKSYVDTKRQYVSVGIADASPPLLTDNGDGTCDIAGCTFVIHSTSDYTGALEKYTIAPATNLGPFDSSGKYVAIDYNGGTPIYAVKTYLQINGSNIVPIYKCWWDGVYLHSIDADSQALGLANKTSTMILSTMPYNRANQSGLILGEAATRYLTVTSSYVYAGTTGIQVEAFNGSQANNLTTFAYYNGSAWVYDRSSTQYDNTQYNPITGLATLNNSKYGVIWVYRSIGDVKEVFYVLGDSEYNNLDAARLAKKRSDIPTLIQQHCLLVGRLIFQKSASSAAEISSAFDMSFAASAVLSHNNLSGLQGGTTDQYYHLTSAQATSATRYASASQDGLLSSTDWSTFNNKMPLSYLDTDRALAANSDVKVASQKAIKSFVTDRYVTNEIPETLGVVYPQEVNFTGTVRNVSDEASLLSALSAASDLDIINLTADITLTSVLTISKTLKFTGNYALIHVSAVGSGTNVTMLTITANNVVFDSGITVRFQKAANNSSDTAISANTTGFIFKGSLEFCEIGFALQGSFSISGNSYYASGNNNNSHRHIAIYSVLAPSQISQVVFRSIAPPTPTGTQYDNLIYITSSGTSKFDSILRVANCTQYDITQTIRQFLFMDAFVKTVGAQPGIIVESCKFNDLNGGIGFVPGDTTSPLDFFSFLLIVNNWQSTLSSNNNAYKGMVYFDSTNVTTRNLGTTTKFYYANNIHGSLLRTAGDYTSALDYTGVSYKNTIYTNSGPLTAQEVNSTLNSAYNYIRNQPSRNAVDALIQAQQDVAEPTGFVDPANITVTYDSTARTITLSHASALYYYYKGVKYNKGTSWTSPAHTNTTGNTYFLYLDSNGVGQWAANAVPDFSDGPFVAYVYFGATDKFAIREVHGLMPWQAWYNAHLATGTLHVSGGLATVGTYAINTNTIAAVTPGMDAASVLDEDLPTTIPALTDGSNYMRIYLDTNAVVFSSGATPYLTTGTASTGSPQYNQNPISGTALTSIAANNRWFNVFGIEVPVTADAGSQAYRWLWMTGQTLHTTLASAQAEDFRTLQLGNLLSLFTEFVPRVRLTFIRTPSNQTYNTQLNVEPSYLVGGKVANTAANINITSVAASRYTTDITWGGSAGAYTMSIAQSVHLRGTSPIVQVQEVASTTATDVDVVVTTDTTTGDITIESTENFTGRIIIL